MIKEFEKGVYEQALNAGHSEKVAQAIAAQAVLDRVTASPAGFAVAETEDFSVTTVYEARFEVTDYRVDQSLGGTVADYVLMDSSSADVINQSWDASSLENFMLTINAGGVQGYIDEHGEFRVNKTRDSTKSVTDWVKARVEEGKLFITTKFKEGFEWVADRFRAVSAEVVVPASKVRVEGSRKVFTGGKIVGFSFTNKPKNPRHTKIGVKKD